MEMIIEQWNQQRELILSVLVAGSAGLLIRVALSAVGQRWVRTYHHTLTFALLPVIALAITKVISGNLTLSIGMVGALSIVRFRNPVKNPFELVMMFALLTIGIAAGVNLKWAILLLGLVLAALVGTRLLERFYLLRNMQLFSLSFEEGMPAHLIETRSSEPVGQLLSASCLQNVQLDKQQNVYNYRLAFRTRQEADDMLRFLQENPTIENVNVRYAGSEA